MVQKSQTSGDRSRSRSPSGEARPILTVLPNDSRNWMVLEMAPRRPSEAAMVMKLKITLPNGVKKDLDLVRQTRTMTVYVNPDPHECDEWEVGGQVFYVGTASNDPPPRTEREVPAQRNQGSSRPSSTDDAAPGSHQSSYWDEI